MLAPIVSWFLVGVDRTEAVRYAKARTVVLGALVGFVVPIGFFVERLVAEPAFGPHHVTVLVAAAAALVAPFILRWTGRHEPAAVALIVVVTATVAADAWFYGGLGAASFVAIMILPLMATLFLGLRAGLLTTAGQLVIVVAFFGLEAAGVALPEPPARHRVAMMHAAATCGVLAFVYLLTRIFENERAKAEAELQLSERRHALAFEVGNDGFVEWHGDGTAYFSHPLAAYVGRDAEELDVDGFLELLSVGARLRLVEAVDAVRGDGEARALDIVLRHRSGEHRTVACVVGRAGVGAGDGAVLCTIRDVHEERRVERVKSEFVSVVSHELRTPLTSIRGALGLLGKDTTALSADKRRNLFDIATRNCDRLEMLVNDLLDFQKLEEGMIELELEHASLGAIAEIAVSEAKPMAEARGVSLRIQAATEASTVLGDPSRLQQVVANFLSNAIKFSSAGDEVVVEVTADDEHGRLSVADRGPGIPEAFRARVFQRFAQADQSDTSGIKGTGLGLAICKAIIDLHEGAIDFDTACGEGTTFWFELPLISATPT